MRAVNGYLENGLFTPLDVITLPKRVQAVLVYNDTSADESRETRLSWLRKFHSAVKEANGEEMPDFPRTQLNHTLVHLSEEG